MTDEMPTPLVAFGQDKTRFAVRVKREEQFAPRVDVKWVSGEGSVEELSILAATAFAHSTFDTSLQFFLAGKTVSAFVPEGSNYRDARFANYVFEDSGGSGVLGGEWRVESARDDEVVFAHFPKVKTT